MKKRLLAPVIAVTLLAACTLPAATQPLKAGVEVWPLAFMPTPLPGHHIDAFQVVSETGIRTLDAILTFGPMAQINPGGQMTVFPDLLAPGDLLKDSHFLFDKTSATITSQYEDTGKLSVSVIFHANFPTSLMLAQAVVTDIHSSYNAQVSGTLVDGRAFFGSIAFVPEPSVVGLGVTGAALWLGWRCAHRCRGRRNGMA